MRQIAKQTLQEAELPHQNWLQMVKIASALQKMFNLYYEELVQLIQHRVLPGLTVI